MIPISLTPPVLKKCLQDSISQRQELIKIYQRIPQTHCRRRTHCCAFLPEITLLEALQIIGQMIQAPSAVREKQIQKTIRYFFTNPVELTGCPFLQGTDCTIYADRFFGCRAYGLWSEEYYGDLLENNRQAKTVLQQQWQNLGVALPKDVLEFSFPYCRSVQTESGIPAFDALLIAASEDIERQSQTIIPWHRLFEEQFFLDLSYFMAGLIYGPLKAVRLKFGIVQDIIERKNRGRLEEALEVIFDPFG